ncbi:ABCG2 [Hepatospora eriocheir]|uniref:ABCG2 n=1 Tax=Hepatospora eriocheir TaxID=1081669 RepID=A0A1X0QFD0_9MICR|nr:ABCG2 [Hepatospora eriocheir]
MGYENLTVKTQIEYAASLYNKNSDEVANNIIDGLYLTGEKEKEYQVCSGGQQVRISIATNLTTKASIYILDEPLTGLDSYSARKAIDAIKELSDLNKTVLLSVHQPSESLFDQFDEFILMTNGSIVFQGTKEEAIKYFASIGFVKEQKFVSYPDFFLKIITLEKDSSNNLTLDSSYKYNLLVDSWLSQAKELEIEYTEPINTKFKKFSVAKKTASILMSKIFSFYFLFNFIIMILPNIKVYLEYCDVNNNDFIITKERLYSYYNDFINIFEEIKTNHNAFKDFIEKYSSKEKLIFEKIKKHFSPDIITSKIKFNVSFKNLMKNSPFLIISTLLFYRFFLLSLFGFNLFYKSIKNHKVEYRKGYYSVVEYLIAIYLISIREFIIMFICDIATFIYFSTNWKFLFVFIIFYLLTFNFIYLICLILSLSFNKFIYYLLSEQLNMCFQIFLFIMRGLLC